MRSMRSIISILLVLVYLIACQKKAVLTVGHNNPNTLIAIQPIGKFDQQQLILLQDRLKGYFQIQVRILEPVKLPTSSDKFSNKIYSADSIIQSLLLLTNDTVIQVVGLIHKEIHILKESKMPNSIKGTPSFFWNKIRGLGYIDESVCIVSDYSLISPDIALWHNRLWKAVLHEIGHNQGIEHCKADSCLMAEKSGDITVLNKFVVDFCKKCKQEIFR